MPLNLLKMSFDFLSFVCRNAQFTPLISFKMPHNQGFMPCKSLDINR